eukprot:gene23123-30324_t
MFLFFRGWANLFILPCLAIPAVGGRGYATLYATLYLYLYATLYLYLYATLYATLLQATPCPWGYSNRTHETCVHQRFLQIPSISFSSSNFELQLSTASMALSIGRCLRSTPKLFLALTLLTIIRAGLAERDEEVLIGWKGETFKDKNNLKAAEGTGDTEETGDDGHAEGTGGTEETGDDGHVLRVKVDREEEPVPGQSKKGRKEGQLRQGGGSGGQQAGQERQLTGVQSIHNTSAGDNGHPWIETVSWAPRAFVYHNFLSTAECDHLVMLGNQRVTQSSVVDSKTGQTKFDDIRTSFGGAFGVGEDPIIAGIEERIAEYENGQKYDAHWDWFGSQLAKGHFGGTGDRVATVLMYLSEVEEGGETALPLADAIDVNAQRLENPSQCAAKQGIAVAPKKGSALMFFDMDVAGAEGDRKALHASCPTLKGMKWTATKWIHNKPYSASYDAMEKASRCMDLIKDCAQRLANGDCDTNPDQMLGPGGVCRKSPDQMLDLGGVSRKSYEDSVQCPKNYILCQRRNLRSLRAKAPST